MRATTTVTDRRSCTLCLRRTNELGCASRLIQARRALLSALNSGARRLVVELPLPAPSRPLTECVRTPDDALFPGGMQQKFRDGMRPLVETLLDGVAVEGDAPAFLGLLESESDGLGVWSCQAFTLVTAVGDQTFRPFKRLMAGEFGKRVLDDSHCVVLVNPYYTRAANVGQLWEVGLRREAESLLDNGGWRTAYALRPVRAEGGGARRRQRGAALLCKPSLEDPFALWPTSGEWDLQVGEVAAVFSQDEAPSSAEVRRALDEVARAPA